MPWEDQSDQGVDIFFGMSDLYDFANMPPRLAMPVSLSYREMDSSYAVTSMQMIPWWNISPIIGHEELATANIETSELYELVRITTWLDPSSDSPRRRFTSANTELKDFILFWHRCKISKRFKVLAQREDNWDGYESKKPNQTTLDHAKFLLIEELLDTIISAGHPWLTPFISSDEDGYVTAEWYEEERELHIQIGENEAEYLQIWGTNIDTEMHEGFLSRDNYLTLWEWLLHG
jgi:hypothetical protein